MGCWQFNIFKYSKDKLHIVDNLHTCRKIHNIIIHCRRHTKEEACKIKMSCAQKEDKMQKVFLSVLKEVLMISKIEKSFRSSRSARELILGDNLEQPLSLARIWVEVFRVWQCVSFLSLHFLPPLLFSPQQYICFDLSLPRLQRPKVSAWLSHSIEKKKEQINYWQGSKKVKQKEVEK